MNHFIIDDDNIFNSEELILIKNDNLNYQQPLFISERWDPTLSNEALNYSVDLTSAFRNEHFEINPILTTPCFSWTSDITVMFEYERRSEISLGILGYEEYKYDFNLASQIGKMKDTWGLVVSSESVVFSEGNELSRFPFLKSKDKVAFHLDLNSDVGFLEIYINDLHIWTLTNIPISKKYLFGIVLSPTYKVTLLPKEIQRSDYSQFEDENEELRSEAKDNTTINLIEQIIGTKSEKLDIQSKPTPVPKYFPVNKNLVSFPNNNQSQPKSEEESSSFCCICLSSPKCVVLLPCKHMCLCESCSFGDSTSIKFCPICRKKINSKMKIFI